MKHIVLNVDDDEAGRFAVSHMLRTSGFEVVEATTGEEALQLVGPHIDLVLLDVNLPGIDGIEVCSRIKSDPRTRTVPVVHLSASRVHQTDRVLGLENGADAYLSEPIAREELVATVRAHIRARTLVEKEVRRRLEFENQLVGIVGHDLRTPLSTIHMSAAVLEQHRDTAVVETAKRIGRTTARMTRLVKEVLDFTQAKLGDGIPIHPAPLELASLLRRTVDDVLVTQPERTIALSGVAEAVGAWDEDRLQQVFINLITNALKHSPEGSAVAIDLQAPAERVVVTITNANRGRPIPAELMPVLFEPFTRGRTGESESIGLGLFIVDHLVRAHRGSIAVESDTNGTRFAVTLPRTGA